MRLANFVKHYRITKEKYDAIENKNPNAIYFIIDTGEIYMDGKCYSKSGGSVDNELSLVSVNPVQNKVITEEINKIKESFQDISEILDDINGEVIT